MMENMRQIISFLNRMVNKKDIGATCSISCVIWAFILIVFVLPFLVKYNTNASFVGGFFLALLTIVFWCITITITFGIVGGILGFLISLFKNEIKTMYIIILSLISDIAFFYGLAFLSTVIPDY